MSGVPGGVQGLGSRVQRSNWATGVHLGERFTSRPHPPGHKESCESPSCAHRRDPLPVSLIDPLTDPSCAVLLVSVNYLFSSISFKIMKIFFSIHHTRKVYKIAISTFATLYVYLLLREFHQGV